MTHRTDQQNEDFMRLAIEQARLAAQADEVPVGAVLVGPDDTIVASAHDERNATADPTAHAEILALRRAAPALGDWRLEDCDLYVTLEPCPMCAGALLLARVRHVYYGALSPKSGAVESHVRLLDIPTFNHTVHSTGGILPEACGTILSGYFQKKRKSV